MILKQQFNPRLSAGSVTPAPPRPPGHRPPRRHPQHCWNPAKQRKVMGLLESLAEATAIMSGELRDTEPTPVHFFIVPCRASVARLMATYLDRAGLSVPPPQLRE